MGFMWSGIDLYRLRYKCKCIYLYRKRYKWFFYNPTKKSYLVSSKCSRCMSDKFFTNQGDNSLLNKFEEVFTQVEQLRYFDVLVGYFRASGYFKVRPFLRQLEANYLAYHVNSATRMPHDARCRAAQKVILYLWSM